MIVVALSLGSNMGQREEIMYRMIDSVNELLAAPVRLSPLMETEPVGASEQQAFINCVVAGGYAGDAPSLLAACRTIEDRLGRQRPYRWAPRTADVDILLFGSAVINDPDLQVPHPRILDRRYCLEGLVALLPTMVLPGTGLTMEEQYRCMPPHVRNQAVCFLRTPAIGSSSNNDGS